MDEMKAVTSPWMAITRRLRSLQLCFEGLSVMLAARGSGSMDADRNPASEMNCLQQNQFENRSPLGCCQQTKS